MRAKTVLVGLLLFILGLAAGGYLFSKSQPRSVLSLQSCHRCLSRSDLQGLIASVLVNRLPAALSPAVVAETDMTVAIKSPQPERTVDYLIVPKKDIKDIGEISEADRPYLIDAYAVIQRLIQKDHLVSYDVISFGPGLQTAHYLHWHLRSGT